jgi:multiple sugar transport system permease protein
LIGESLSIGPVEISPDGVWGFLTVLPVICLYLLIAVVPVSFAFVASLHQIPLMNPVWEYVGFSNYTTVFNLDRFWASMWRGVYYMIGSTILQTIVGVWIALTLNKMDFGQRILSSIVFSIYLIPTIIVVLVALFLLDPFIGFLHVYFGQGLGLWEGFLLGNTDLAMPAVILVGTWKFSVFITIFTLAQLRSIPDHFYEAAKVCGANTWEMFRDITFPRIRGALLVAVFLRSIFMFNKFDVIYPLTQGGPGYATTTMPILAYRETFQGSTYGLGNAIAMVMFVFLAIGGVLYLWALDPSEEVDT